MARPTIDHPAIALDDPDLLPEDLQYELIAKNKKKTMAELLAAQRVKEEENKRINEYLASPSENPLISTVKETGRDFARVPGTVGRAMANAGVDIMDQVNQVAALDPTGRLNKYGQEGQRAISKELGQAKAGLQQIEEEEGVKNDLLSGVSRSVGGAAVSIPVKYANPVGLGVMAIEGTLGGMTKGQTAGDVAQRIMDDLGADVPADERSALEKLKDTWQGAKEGAKDALFYKFVNKAAEYAKPGTGRVLAEGLANAIPAGLQKGATLDSVISEFVTGAGLGLRSRNAPQRDFKSDVAKAGKYVADEYKKAFFGLPANAVAGIEGGGGKPPVKPEAAPKTVRLYHGTSRDFNEFSMNPDSRATLGGFSKHGISLTPERKVAERYANDFPEGGNPRVIEADVSIRNPLRLSAIEFEKLQTLTNKLDKGESLSETQSVDLEMMMNKIGDGYPIDSHPIDFIKSKGHDAIMKVPRAGTLAESEVLVFDPQNISQINKATDKKQKAPKDIAEPEIKQTSDATTSGSGEGSSEAIQRATQAGISFYTVGKGSDDFDYQGISTDAANKDTPKGKVGVMVSRNESGEIEVKVVNNNNANFDVNERLSQFKTSIESSLPKVNPKQLETKKGITVTNVETGKQEYISPNDKVRANKLNDNQWTIEDGVRVITDDAGARALLENTTDTSGGKAHEKIKKALETSYDIAGTAGEDAFRASMGGKPWPKNKQDVNADLTAVEPPVVGKETQALPTVDPGNAGERTEVDLEFPNTINEPPAIEPPQVDLDFTPKENGRPLVPTVKKIVAEKLGEDIANGMEVDLAVHTDKAHVDAYKRRVEEVGLDGLAKELIGKKEHNDWDVSAAAGVLNQMAPDNPLFLRLADTASLERSKAGQQLRAARVNVLDNPAAVKAINQARSRRKHPKQKDKWEQAGKEADAGTKATTDINSKAAGTHAGKIAAGVDRIVGRRVKGEGGKKKDADTIDSLTGILEDEFKSKFKKGTFRFGEEKGKTKTETPEDIFLGKLKEVERKFDEMSRRLAEKIKKSQGIVDQKKAPEEIDQLFKQLVDMADTAVKFKAGVKPSPEQPKFQPDNFRERIINDMPTEFQGVFDKAKDLLKEKYKDNPEALFALEEVMGIDGLKPVDTFKIKGTVPSISDRLAEKFSNRADPKDKKPLTAEQKYLADATKTIYDAVKDTVEKMEVPAVDPTDAAVNRFKTAIQNRQEYAAALQNAKKILQSKYADNPEVLFALEELFGTKLKQPFHDKLLEQVVRGELTRGEIDLGALIKEHYSAVDLTGKTLTDKLVERLGLTPPEAKAAARYIRDSFDNLTRKAKEQALRRAFPEKAKTKQGKEFMQKIIEMSNMGAIDNVALHDQIAKRLGVPVISPEHLRKLNDMAQEIQKMPEVTDEEFEAKLIRIGELNALVHEDIPPSGWDKLWSYRKTAMLLSGKSAVRNTVGQTANMYMDVFAKKFLGMRYDDYLTKQINQTTPGAATRTLAESSWKITGGRFKKYLQDAKTDVAKGIDTTALRRERDLNRRYPGANLKVGKETNKYGTGQKLFSDKSIVGWAQKKTGYMLSVPDRIVGDATFWTSVENQMKAAGVDRPTQDMVNQANLESEQAAYRDVNRLSQTVVDIQKRMGWLGEVMLTFPRVSANLAHRAMVTYSPVGLARAKSRGREMIKTGKNYVERPGPNGSTVKVTQRQAVMDVARGRAGTALWALGALAGFYGVATGSRDDDTKAQKTMEASGRKPNSINIFGHNFTIDWAQPASGVFAIGAEIGKAMRDKDYSPEGVLNAINNGMGSMFEQPLFTGVSRALTGRGTTWDRIQYGLKATMQSAPASLIPTAFAQTRQLLDPYKRITMRHTGSNGWETIGDWVGGAGAMMINKIPLLASVLPKDQDIFGNDIKFHQATMLGGLSQFVLDPLDRFLNPAITTDLKDDPGLEFIMALDRKVKAAGGNKSPLPKDVSRTYTVSKGGKKYWLTNDQRRRYRMQVGRDTYNYIEGFFADKSLHGNMTQEEQAAALYKAISEIGHANLEELKREVIPDY